MSAKLARGAGLSMTHRFSYDWAMKDGYQAKNGRKVMSTFSCCGGSTMGYKLAGFDVVAANDIDPEMAKVYKKNHKPRQYFLGSVTDLLDRDDLPKVDILDGSPPCSLFSTTGIRDKGWQEEKKFREGQAFQVLDDLFFRFIDLAEKMQPRVVIAENVKGMILGKAKWYTREVFRRFKAIGYSCQIFLLNGNRMGLPQSRERLFFVASKPRSVLELKFTEPIIPFSKVSDNSPMTRNDRLTDKYVGYWNAAKEGQAVGKFVTFKKVNWDKPSPTTLATNRHFHPRQCRKLRDSELIKINSFPSDFDFMNLDPVYPTGMSVPPVMMANIAHEVYRQIFKGCS